MTEAPSRAPLRRNAGVAFLALLASGGTLVCCVLPAVMVSLGAGAALAGLVTAVPQLVWLSQHKALVFGVAVAMLLLSGALLWHARTLPCPADPGLARTCRRLRRLSVGLWAAAAIAVATGVLFAFVLPAANASAGSGNGLPPVAVPALFAGRPAKAGLACPTAPGSRSAEGPRSCVCAGRLAL